MGFFKTRKGRLRVWVYILVFLIIVPVAGLGLAMVIQPERFARDDACVSTGEGTIGLGNMGTIGHGGGGGDFTENTHDLYSLSSDLGRPGQSPGRSVWAAASGPPSGDPLRLPDQLLPSPEITDGIDWVLPWTGAP